MSFVRVYKTKMGNAAKTLDKTIKINDIYQKIDDEKIKHSFSELLPFGELNFWDFGVKATAQLSQGDHLKIVCGSNCYSCELIKIIKDEKGILGNLFEWARQFKEPWRNVAALIVHNIDNISENDLNILRKKATIITNSFLKISGPVNNESQKYFEGKSYDVILNKYERNTEARRKCIEHHKCICSVCEFDFEKIYGAIGKNFIHVHHLTPLSEIKKEYSLDPIKDLIPVCPNCHAMIHRVKPALSIKELKKLIS